MKHIFFSLALLITVPLYGQVNMTQTKQKIHTYQIDAPETDPIFFTGRVYQGAEGYIYPYPLYDKLTDKETEQEYNVLNLNNKYIDIDILPEIGGRIFRAEDKTDNYHFFYTQTGVKPALIGMLGAWLSGGVEWNIPDHHRASSYMPVNWKLKENKDGSKTIWVGETELRHRLKWSVGVTVYPERSWVEAKIRVINPTPMIQSMLYWANVSVHCNDDYQVIFPPDVQFGVDHHKVYFTTWPEGPLSKGNKENINLSWWKNFTNDSRSIFAYGSQMDFLAGYDYGKDAGTVHVANRNVVPGKKFFLWGNNPNGMMWNKILSDKDGHYLELMVGAYSDNQPDYSWISPGEIREFNQIWYPIKGIKGVKNATIDAAVNLESIGGNKYRVGYCATTLYKNAKVIVKNGNNTILEKQINIDPDNYFYEEIDIQNLSDTQSLYTALYDDKGNILVEYTPVKLKEKPLPSVIDGTQPVKDYKTNEELYLAGLRVDQFNNARLQYMDFYNEALSRDSLDARVNIEVGKHYIRQGEYDKALMHLLRAQKRLSHDYTRMKNTEALYYLGYAYCMTGDRTAAEESYWAATWMPEFKHSAFYELAVMATQDKDYAKAAEMITNSLLVGSHDLQALTLQAYILRMQGKTKEANAIIDKIQEIDPLDYWSAIERSMIESDNDSHLKSDLKFRNNGIIAVQELMEVANNYMTIGAYQDALTLINNAISVGKPYSDYPLMFYYKAYNLIKTGNDSEAANSMTQAEKLSPLNNFPLRLEEITLFDTLLDKNPDNAMLLYYKGNLLYYLGQKDAGLKDWELSANLKPSFAIACRNAGFAYGQKKDYNNAIKYYDMAIKANPNDALMFTESDKLYEEAGWQIKDRLKRLEANKKTVLQHDDAVMRLLTLYNESGQYDKAISIMDTRHFHLWEGGGQIHEIYVDSHMLKGIKSLDNKRYNDAIKEFDLANQYPENLEVAPSSRGGYGSKAYYLTGLAYEGLNQADKAKEFFAKSAEALSNSNSIDLSYYKVKALRKLGKKDDADETLSKMQKTVENRKNNLMDSYAKFGEANKNVQQSELKYNEGLIKLLEGNDASAKEDFSQAISLYSGNIWANTMNKTVIK